MVACSIKYKPSNLAQEIFVQTLSYQYDNDGRLSRTTYPSGTQISTLYGVDGRPSEIQVDGVTLIQNIAYQPFGVVKGWTWGNGQVHTRHFDLDGRLTQHPMGNDTRAITYDATSQIIQTSDTNPVYNRGYTYDELGRLIGRSDNTSFRLWTYDANSNRTSVQSGSKIYPYILDDKSNRLMSVAGPVAKTYTYDATGNVVNDGLTNFTWNAAGRLRKIIRGEKIRKYKYNGTGERIRRNGANKRRSAFLYDAAGHLVSEYKARNIRKENWRLKQETIWLDDIPIAVLKKTVSTDSIQVYFIHADHLNTPRVIVDVSNTPVWRWENRQAFGDNFPDEDPDGDGTLFKYNLRFAGQYFDNETRLHYNYFRNYDPETGRYISSDPIGLAGGLNVYGYASGNPLIYTDPLGLRRIGRDIREALENLPDPGIEVRNREPGIHCYGFLACDVEPPKNNSRQLRRRILICPPEDSKCTPSPINGVKDLLNPGCYVKNGPVIENQR
jgi:RHS repeat-associated protein